jgi:short-subunit dehydrogenase involved in D-alanine esterification of teichoic acids
LYQSSELLIGKLIKEEKFFNTVMLCMYVTEAFKKTHTTFKALDIVINNAGILDDGRWELQIAINVVSI